MEPRSGEAVPASVDARIGTRLAGYRVEAPLGRGGMSVVYKAQDLRLRRQVALKVLSADLASNVHFRERFLRESELAASIDHPNIVPIYEADESDGCLFIAMRYVEGTDLRTLLRVEGPLGPLRSIAIATQVADALDAAHEHGLVHRDVKPSNVLVDPRGHCYLSDFGLTTSAADRSGLAAQHEVAGTLDYVAPEQLRSEPVDGRTDVYSLGCLLFECLTGEVPFPHDSDVAVIYAQLEQPPPSVSDRNPHVPRGLDAPLARAMSKQPDARFATCRALVDAAREGMGLVPDARRRHVRLRTAAVAASVAAVVAASAIAGWLATRPGRGIPHGGHALVRIDPRAEAVSRTTRVSDQATAVTVGGNDVWIANYGDDSVTRVDVATDRLRTIRVPGAPVHLAASGDLLDVVDGPPSSAVVTINGTTGQAGEPTPFSGDQSFAPLIAAGGTTFWLAEAESHTLWSADAAGQFSVATTRTSIPQDRTSVLTEYVSLTGLASGENAIWVAGDTYGRAIWRIDPRTRKVTRIHLPFIPAGIAAGEGAVWVTSLLDDSVARIDPSTGRIVRRIKVGKGAYALAVGAGAVWVADSLADAVSRIDPASNRVTTIHVAVSPTDIAAGATGVWVIGRKP